MMRCIRVALGALVGAVIAMMVLGSGSASAVPAYYGSTYAKAAEKIQSRGQTVAISTVVGSALPTDDCIVVNSHKSMTLDSSGRTAHRNTWMLDLNCNLALAQPGKPGNSLATPEGQKQKALELKGQSISRDFAKALSKNKSPYCEANASRCLDICQQSGACSGELLKYLGL